MTCGTGRTASRTAPRPPFAAARRWCSSGSSTPMHAYLASVTRALVARLPVPVIVNDRADIALACGAAGVPRRDRRHPVAADIRRIAPPGFLIGVSVGSDAEVAQRRRRRLRRDRSGLRQRVEARRRQRDWAPRIRAPCRRGRSPRDRHRRDHGRHCGRCDRGRRLGDRRHRRRSSGPVIRRPPHARSGARSTGHDRGRGGSHLGARRAPDSTRAPVGVQE